MKGKPRHLADRIRSRRQPSANDGFIRETFTLPRDAAGAKARDILQRYPAGGYGTIVEDWQALPTGEITFTMRRLPTAD